MNPAKSHAQSQIVLLKHKYFHKTSKILLNMARTLAQWPANVDNIHTLRHIAKGILKFIYVKTDDAWVLYMIP